MIRPESLRKVRIEKGLSQRQLARMSGVSQATISLIENGKTRPGFETMEKLSNALQTRGEKAGEVMRKGVIFVRPEEPARKARILMKRHGISQIPVIGNVVEGTIRESDLIDAPQNAAARDVMSPPLPIVDVSTPLDAAKAMLKAMDAVLVSERGRIVGILTKSDLL